MKKDSKTKYQMTKAFKIFLYCLPLLLLIYTFTIWYFYFDGKSIFNNFISNKNSETQEYTELKLVDNSDLLVKLDDLQTLDINKKIIYYYMKDSNNSYPIPERFPKSTEYISLSIINGDQISGENSLRIMESNKQDIINHNIAAPWVELGSPEIFQEIETGTYTFVQEIKDIDIPQAQYVFATLSLGGHVALMPAEDEGELVYFSIYAIVDKNILHYNLEGRTRTILDISEEEHKSCLKPFPGDPEYNMYDYKCLTELLKDPKHEKEIRNRFEELVKVFELE